MSTGAKITLNAFPPLDGTNYTQWRDNMLNFLRLIPAKEIVEGTEKEPSPGATNVEAIKDWKERNNKAITFISLYCTEEVKRYLKNADGNLEDSSATIWESLKKAYDYTNILAAAIDYRKATRFDIDGNRDMNVQITELLALFDSIKRNKVTIDDTSKVLTLYNALPPSYNTAISAYIATVTDWTKFKIDVLIPVIRQEEMRQKNDGGQASVSRISQTTRLPLGPCKKCGKTNHTTENCWGSNRPNNRPSNKGYTNNRGQGNSGNSKNSKQKKGGNYNKANKDNKGKGRAFTNKRRGINSITIGDEPVFDSDDELINVSLYTMSETKNAMWLIDSGATSHATNNKNDFFTYQAATTPGTVDIAGKGMTIQVLGRGTVVMDIQIKSGDKRRVTLNNVLYIPEGNTRYFSPTSILDKNCQSILADRSWTITKDDREIIYGLKDIYGLFWIRSTIIKSQDHFNAISSSVKIRNYELWHNRLGHPGKKILEKLSVGTNGTPTNISIPTDTSPCYGCLTGKGKRSPFPPSESRAEHPLDLIHSDLVDFPSQSIDNYRYAATFLDDYSSYGQQFYLKTKDQTLEAFKEFKTWAELKLNRKIKMFRSDRGGEFMSNEMSRFLKSSGIEHQKSVALSPQQNGRAERWQQTIVFKAEAMRHQAGLSNGFLETCMRNRRSCE